MNYRRYLRQAAMLISLLAVTISTLQQALADSPWQPLPTGTVQRIAFGSCAKQWQPQPIWQTILKKQPDLWLYLGDAIYADTDGKTAWLVSEQQLAGEWNRLSDKPEFQQARAAMPMLATWDNHDYGSHAGGKEFPVKQASQRIFLDFFGEPSDSLRRQTPGIYDAKVLGPPGRRVQIILLDSRYFKDAYTLDPSPKSERLAKGKVGGFIADNDPDKTLLGAAQWHWLAEQLRQPAELRLIVSSIQIIADTKGMDEWGNLPRERQKLFDLIESSGAGGVVLLSGNVHFAELSKHYAGSYPLFELTSSGMTHTTESYASAANEYRIAGPSTALNFGMVEIDWQAQPSARITLSVVDDSGATVLSHEVALAGLRADPEVNSAGLNVCPEPRPEVCASNYRPVCAQRAGADKTYANGCSACSDPQVVGYREGVCE
ncbi:MAG: alkaline phosphatase D family protein [Amphritea sp.]